MNVPDHVKPLETKNVSVIQANGKDITLADNRYETFIFNTPCRHGAPTDELEVIYRLPLIDGHDEARSRAIRLVDRAHEGDKTNRADYKMEYATAIQSAAIAFWSDPRHSLYVDDAMVKLLYAMAAENLLTGNDIGIVRRWNTLATMFRERLKDSATNSSDLLLKQQTYKARTDGGLKIVLNKNIPCSCLAEQRAAAKAAPRTDMCYYCRAQDSEVKLLVCSRCKLAAYCSPDCQRKDWKFHKTRCSPNAREFISNSTSSQVGAEQDYDDVD